MTKHLGYLSLLRTLLDIWPKMPTTIAKVIEESEQHPEMQAVLAELPSRDGDRGRALGYFLRDVRGRVIGGNKFERLENTRPTKWQVSKA
jgi:hypothetical protein